MVEVKAATSFIVSIMRMSRTMEAAGDECALLEMLILNSVGLHCRKVLTSWSPFFDYFIDSSHFPFSIHRMCTFSLSPAWHLRYLLSPVSERENEKKLHKHVYENKKTFLVFRILSEDERTQSQFLSPSKNSWCCFLTLFFYGERHRRSFSGCCGYFNALSKNKALK